MSGRAGRTQPQLETYFRHYIQNVLGRKASTANHYIQGLRTVSRYLRDAGLIDGHLFEVEELPRLLALRDALLGIREFVVQDETGNRMYSAGLNRYIEFAELNLGAGEEPDETTETKPVDLTRLDAPIPVPDKTKSVTVRRSRDRIIVQQVLRACTYRCEVNGTHETFVARSTKLPYLEGHHLVPLAQQARFGNSLDVYANLIGLCPLCHRKLHYAENGIRRGMLAPLYDARAARFSKSGIGMSKDEFLAAACP